MDRKTFTEFLVWLEQVKGPTGSCYSKRKSYVNKNGKMVCTRSTYKEVANTALVEKPLALSTEELLAYLAANPAVAEYLRDNPAAVIS